jgi:hypothetical protein
MQTAELELAFWGRDASHYAAEVRYSGPATEADLRAGGESPILIGWERLRELQAEPEAYGAALTKSVFADERLLTAFCEAVSVAEAAKLTLRLKLSFSTSAARLHDLRWETLRNPRTGNRLATSERILLSRFLESFDWRPVGIIPKAQMRALVVVASPSDLSDYTPDQRVLHPIDVPGEEARARAYFRGIEVTVLASPGGATVSNIVDELRKGHEILYLLCHGALIEGEPVIWLEDETGPAAPVPGRELITRLRQLQQDLPRLVVLASCQSAGTGTEARSDDKGCLAALGPQLAAVGVPAVLAMQGDVSMKTVEAFMPKLFDELWQDGQIDRATAVARATVMDRHDWWVPVLFTRLKSGRLWYTPGFAGANPFEKWPAIILDIRERNLTPILGPGLIDPYLGSRQQIAEQWAEQYGFPLAPHLRGDLPHVAQFLAVRLGLAFPRRELSRYLARELRRRHAQDLRGVDEKAELHELLRKVAAVRRASDPYEPHRVLAQLPLPVYITTNFGSLLTDALEEANKKPVWDYFRWKQDLVRRPSPYKQRLAQGPYEPSPEEPLVYHLFGHSSVSDSVVLTEDDYFRYLLGAMEPRRQIPEPVLRALTDKALLFLGHQLDDWSFRVLFWTLIAHGGGRRGDYTHVAAQLDPEEGRIIDSARARRYLDDYFKQQAIALRLDIYWGTTAHFVRELQQVLTMRAGPHDR